MQASSGLLTRAVIYFFRIFWVFDSGMTFGLCVVVTDTIYSVARPSLKGAHVRVVMSCVIFSSLGARLTAVLTS